MSDAPFRVLPAITDRNRPFWNAGRDGVLRFQRCQDSAPSCPAAVGRQTTRGARPTAPQLASR